MLIKSLQKWKLKPKIWGPPSLVQQSIFRNCERIYGIDPSTMVMCLPFWMEGGKHAVNYAKQYNTASWAGTDWAEWISGGFDASGTRIHFTVAGINDDGLNFGTDSSLELQQHSWVASLNIHSILTTGILFSKEHITEDGYLWGMDNAYRMWYYYYDGGIRGLYKTTHTLSLYTDYNIGGVWDQSNSKVYYWHDGVNTDNDATTNGTITHNSSRPFLFMQRHADWAGSTGSNYDFMFFALFNVVLTDEQMHLLAERPYGMLEETVAPVYHWGVAAAAEQTMPIISDAGVHNAIYHGLVISG